jgi:hypothetical protein
MEVASKVNRTAPWFQWLQTRFNVQYLQRFSPDEELKRVRQVSRKLLEHMVSKEHSTLKPIQDACLRTQ